MSTVTPCGRWPCLWPHCACQPGNQHPGWQPLPAPTHPYQPQLPAYIPAPQPRGCICPPGSEATCKGDHCPRQPAKDFFPKSGATP